MSLTIEFDSPDAKYANGKAVTGKVTLVNNTPIEATNLKMTMFVVFGLNVSEEKRIELRNQFKNAGNKYRTEHPTETKRYIIEENVIHLVKDDKRKTKIYPIGSHIFDFSFAPLPTNCVYSWNNSSSYNRYIVEAQLGMRSTKDCLTVQKSIIVMGLHLEDIKAAQEWQTKIGSKFTGLSLKKQTIKVTVPTGVGRDESVPIHILIINESDNPAVIIRSKLIQKHRNPYGFRIIAEKENTRSENLQETHGNQVLHLLKLDRKNIGQSFDSPHMSSSFYIQVEVETTSSTIVKMDFPVIVGNWNGKPKRLELENYLESKNETLSIPVPPALPPKKPTKTPSISESSPDKEILKIELNAPDALYLPGQKVCGTVILEHSVPITATCLKMSMFEFFRVKESSNDDLYIANKTEGKSRLIGEVTVYPMDLNAEENNSYPVGLRTFEFYFPALPLDITPCWTTSNTVFNYYVRADLNTNVGIITKSENFDVNPCPLENNEAAQNWQTKIDSKHTGLSSKGISMNVTVPTGVGYDESIPIHIFIKNQSDESPAIVRSRLLRRAHEKLEGYPEEKICEEIKSTVIKKLDQDANEQRIDLSLKTNDILISIDCLYISSLYYLQVEMETSDLTLLKVQFPVIVGSWRDGKPIRPELEKYLESNSTTQSTLVSSILPSAPPEEHVGSSIAPPSYEEACLAAPQMYPSLPQKF